MFYQLWKFGPKLGNPQYYHKREKFYSRAMPFLKLKNNEYHIWMDLKDALYHFGTIDIEIYECPPFWPKMTPNFFFFLKINSLEMAVRYI